MTCDVPAADLRLDIEELSSIIKINNYRRANGLDGLQPSALLGRTAAWKARDMATHGVMSHTDSLGRSPFDLMVACGYVQNTWKGENIAVGTPSGGIVLGLWKASPGHNALLLSRNYRSLGIARHKGWWGSWETYYWALEFGGV